MLRCHGGDLYVALGAVAVSGETLRVGRHLGQLWADLGRELNDQKRRKFAALPPDEQHRAVFAPSGTGGSEPGCAVCRREGLDDNLPPPEERKCTLCASLERLGADLREAAYLYLGTVDPELPIGPTREYRDTLRAFGVEPRLFADADELRRRGGGLGRGTLFALRSTELLETLSAVGPPAGSQLAFGFYLLANVTPRKGHAIAEFEDLAVASRGARRLGILRMDVDDLGQIFARGLGDVATLSRVANLSFLLRLYFEGWVAELARRHNPGGHADQDADRVYVIYSGGDDLFLVGSWDRVARLAGEIRHDFSRFAAHNPDLHLSGGVVLQEEHFPLYQAAEQAGEALDRAKGRQSDGRIVKDALDFLGLTAGWDDIATAERRSAELVDLVEAGQAPRALVHTLARIYQLYLDASRRVGRDGRKRRDDQVPYGRWMWASAYTLTRMAERARAPAGARIRELQDEVLRPDGIRTLGLAARWAELSLRKEAKGR